MATGINRNIVMLQDGRPFSTTFAVNFYGLSHSVESTDSFAYEKIKVAGLDPALKAQLSVNAIHPLGQFGAATTNRS